MFVERIPLSRATQSRPAQFVVSIFRPHVTSNFPKSCNYFHCLLPIQGTTSRTSSPLRLSSNSSHIRSPHCQAMDSLELPLPPARGSAAYYRNELRKWWAESYANEKVVYFITFILLGGTTFGFSFKFFLGTCHYCLSYFRAALWDDVVQDSCAAVKQESQPFWNLSFSDYSRWNRCFGNEAGFERQGQLFLIAQDFIFHVLGPFGRSPILVSFRIMQLFQANERQILVFAISVWILGPWLGRQVCSYISHNKFLLTLSGLGFGHLYFHDSIYFVAPSCDGSHLALQSRIYCLVLCRAWCAPRGTNSSVRYSIFYS